MKQQEKHTRPKSDFGPEPFAVNLACAAKQNQLFRRALWTGCRLQLTLMCIPPCGEIGLEVHPDTEQFLRFEEGQGLVKMGASRDRLEVQKTICAGDALFVPAGTWHNVINTGQSPLKLYTVYAPPHHPRGTVQHTKEEADAKNH